MDGGGTGMQVFNYEIVGKVHERSENSERSERSERSEQNERSELYERSEYLQLGVWGRCKPPSGVQGRSPGKFLGFWGYHEQF